MGMSMSDLIANLKYATQISKFFPTIFCSSRSELVLNDRNTAGGVANMAPE